MIAEVGQTFTCELVSVNNGGKLDSTLSQARVHIPANDEVEGIVSIDSSTRFVIAGEPMLGHDGVFVVRLVRLTLTSSFISKYLFLTDFKVCTMVRTEFKGEPFIT